MAKFCYQKVRQGVFVPNNDCFNFAEENDEVLVAGFCQKGQAVSDNPRVRFKVVKIASVSLLASYKSKKESSRSQIVMMKTQ
jgi:small subunit ribosomal protein S23e